MMTEKAKNTWSAKMKRTVTSALPISGNRRGQCVNCGACCRLPNVCAFLRHNANGQWLCAIYPIRPLNCRKYPRSASEHITKETCGYRFE